MDRRERTRDRVLSTTEDILRNDPSNSQAHLRLGYERLRLDDCAHAEREFQIAIDAGLPGADAHLGLANCLGRRNDLAGAERVLREAHQREPGNPVVCANIGILLFGTWAGVLADRVRRRRALYLTQSLMLAQALVPPGLPVANFCGEPLPRAICDQLFALGVDEIWNLYGPCEDTTYSTAHRVVAGELGPPAIGCSSMPPLTTCEIQGCG